MGSCFSRLAGAPVLNSPAACPAQMASRGLGMALGFGVLPRAGVVLAVLLLNWSGSAALQAGEKGKYQTARQAEAGYLPRHAFLIRAMTSYQRLDSPPPPHPPPTASSGCCGTRPGVMLKKARWGARPTRPSIPFPWRKEKPSHPGQRGHGSLPGLEPKRPGAASGGGVR